MLGADCTVEADTSWDQLKHAISVAHQLPDPAIRLGEVKLGTHAIFTSSSGPDFGAHGQPSPKPDLSISAPRSSALTVSAEIHRR
jgi:hypothetical protein